MMTLLLLLFGTISDVFVVRATWPIVRYKNGTVGVKNETAVRDAPPTPPAQRSHDFDAAGKNPRYGWSAWVNY